MGTSPSWRRRILSASMSIQTTSLPRSAKQAPVTRPTYPVPMTAIFMTNDCREQPPTTAIFRSIEVPMPGDVRRSGNGIDEDWNELAARDDAGGQAASDVTVGLQSAAALQLDAGPALAVTP